MKSFLSIVTVFVFACTLQAQNLTINPNPAIGEDPDLTGTGIAHATLANNGPEMKNDIHWVRVTNELTTGWKSMICDFTYCYAATTSMAPTPLVLGAGESGEVKTQFSTYEIAGEGYVEIKYYSQSDSVNYNTMGVFIYSADGVGFSSPSSDNSFAVYPNPAANEVNLMASYNGNITSVQVLNIVGKTILSSTWNSASGKMTLPVNTIAEGIYFVQFLNTNHEVVATKKLSVKH